MGERGSVTRMLLAGARDVTDGVGVAEQVCLACVRGLDVDGAAISVLTESPSRETLFASDVTVARVEELQYTLGQGVCVDAAETGRPVLVPDLADAASRARWPVFAAEVVAQTGLGALFAVPLQLGTINLGVLDLYRMAPGSLGEAQLTEVMRVTEAATMMLVGPRTGRGEHLLGDWAASSHAEVHQATGMLIAELGVGWAGGVRPAARVFFRPGPVAQRRGPRCGDPAVAVHRGAVVIVGPRSVEEVAVTEWETGRERLLIEAFVSMADTLVDDYDVIDLLDRLVRYCGDLLAADTAGIMLADPSGRLRVLASSNEQTERVELLQLQSEQGPCVECYRTLAPVSVPDLDRAADRWPRFVDGLRRRSNGQYRSVHAVPMRLRGRALGGLNLYHRDPGALPEADLNLAQGLADVATIGILQERSIHHGEVLNEQLQTALNSRVIIEQAKGVLAERGGLDMDAAFDQLRAQARGRRQRLSDLSRQVVEDRLSVDDMLAPPAAAAGGD